MPTHHIWMCFGRSVGCIEPMRTANIGYQYAESINYLVRFRQIHDLRLACHVKDY